MAHTRPTTKPMPEAPRQPAEAHQVRLSPSETAELVARLSELTGSGLPLGDGLRAVADEQTGRRAAAGLRRLAARIDAGEPLEEALAEACRSDAVGPALQRLLLLGVRNHCLAEVLEESIDLAARRAAVRRQLWTAVAYPIVLVLAMCGVWALLDAFAFQPIWELCQDFGLDLPDFTILAYAIGRIAQVVFATILALLLLTPVVFRFVRRREMTWRLLAAVPVLGPMGRWQSRAELARWLALAMGGEGTQPAEGPAEPASASRSRIRLPLPEAVRLAGAGVADVELRRQCEALAAELEGGRPAAEAFAHTGPFPAGFGHVAQWAEAHGAWPEAFESMAAWYERLLRSHVRWIEAALPPLMVLVVVTMILVINTAMLAPLLGLIQRLT